MRPSDSRFLHFIIRYIQFLFWLYAIVYAFLAMFFLIGYIVRGIIKIIDYVIYKTTGIALLKPHTFKREIKLDTTDWSVISAFILVFSMVYWIYTNQPGRHHHNERDYLAQSTSSTLASDNQEPSQSIHLDNSRSIVSDTVKSNVVSATASDTAIKVSSTTIKTVDTIELIKQDWKHGNDGKFMLSDKLPLTYSYGSEKYIFKRENDSIKVDCYNSTGLYGTFSCNQQDNKLIMDADGFFDMTNGKLSLISPTKKYAIQLALVRN